MGSTQKWISIVKKTFEKGGLKTSQKQKTEKREKKYVRRRRLRQFVSKAPIKKTPFLIT